MVRGPIYVLLRHGKPGLPRQLRSFADEDFAVLLAMISRRNRLMDVSIEFLSANNE